MMNRENSFGFLPVGSITLRDWNILIVDLPGLEPQEIFIGFSVKDKIGRVSTPIQYFDIKTGQGITRSGSSYQTVGDPGPPHDDAIYILEQIVGKSTVVKELFSDECSGGILNFKYLSK